MEPYTQDYEWRGGVTYNYFVNPRPEELSLTSLFGHTQGISIPPETARWIDVSGRKWGVLVDEDTTVMIRRADGLNSSVMFHKGTIEFQQIIDVPLHSHRFGYRYHSKVVHSFDQTRGVGTERETHIFATLSLPTRDGSFSQARLNYTNIGYGGRELIFSCNEANHLATHRFTSFAAEQDESSDGVEANFWHADESAPKLSGRAMHLKLHLPSNIPHFPLDAPGPLGEYTPDLPHLLDGVLTMVGFQSYLYRDMNQPQSFWQKLCTNVEIISRSPGTPGLWFPANFIPSILRPR